VGLIFKISPGFITSAVEAIKVKNAYSICNCKKNMLSKNNYRYFSPIWQLREAEGFVDLRDFS
jgi:hypothetical protein